MSTTLFVVNTLTSVRKYTTHRQVSVDLPLTDKCQQVCHSLTNVSRWHLCDKCHTPTSVGRHTTHRQVSAGVPHTDKCQQVCHSLTSASRYTTHRQVSAGVPFISKCQYTTHRHDISKSCIQFIGKLLNSSNTSTKGLWLVDREVFFFLLLFWKFNIYRNQNKWLSNRCLKTFLKKTKDLHDTPLTVKIRIELKLYRNNEP